MTQPAQPPTLPERVASLVLLDELARGGMGAVYLARRGPPGSFSRLVAVKRVHHHLLADPAIRGPFVDEARVALRIRHPHCVATEEVVAHDGELMLVMELLEGATAAQLAGHARRRGERIPIPVALGIIEGALRGLHAAHETVDENGVRIGLVHRDVSPQNVFVCTDGNAKLLDFGVVMAAGRVAQTAEGVVKGKFPYMAPEQLRRGELDARTDLYAMGVVLWEMLTGRRLVASNDPAACMGEVLTRVAPLPSVFRHETPAWLDDLCKVLLVKRRDDRPASAEAVAERIRASGEMASPSAIAAYVRDVAGAAIEARRAKDRALALLEPAPTPSDPLPTAGGLGTTVYAPLPAPGSERMRRFIAGGVLVSVAMLAYSLFRDGPARIAPPPAAAPLAASSAAVTSLPTSAPEAAPPSPLPASSDSVSAVIPPPPSTTGPAKGTAPKSKPGSRGASISCAKNPFHKVNGIEQLRPECAR